MTTALKQLAGWLKADGYSVTLDGKNLSIPQVQLHKKGCNWNMIEDMFAQAHPNLKIILVHSTMEEMNLTASNR